jgi:hypothetical protein
MPHFKIFVDDVVTQTKSKVFKAETMAEAIKQAEADNWTDWELASENSFAEVREELCEQVSGDEEKED